MKYAPCITKILIAGIVFSMTAAPVLAHAEPGSGKGNKQVGDSDKNQDSGEKNPGKGPGGSKEKRKFRVSMAAPEGVSTAAKAKIDYKLEANSKQREEHLSAKLQFALPSTVPAVTDATSAATLTFLLAFERAGTRYAECTLAFHRVKAEDADDDTSVSKAEYRLEGMNKVKRGKTRLQLKRGNCDTDLVTAEVQSGLPAVQDGDTLSLVDAAGLVFLVGEF